MKPQAEYIVSCRACGNHCMVVERTSPAVAGDEVAYSDGFLGGWAGVQSEVVTCPHCTLVMSWRKSCQSADLLRQAGDLGRFKIPDAAWGPAGLYWIGFDQYDAEFHKPSPSARSATLPRMKQAPDESRIWALRKRAALARGLLWLDNDRNRVEHFFGRTPAKGPRSSDEERRRARLLRALLEGALFAGDGSELNTLEAAEWHRELGEWEEALKLLEREFHDPLLAVRAEQLRDLAAAGIGTVVPFEDEPFDEPAETPASAMEDEPATLAGELPPFELPAFELEPLPEPAAPPPQRAPASAAAPVAAPPVEPTPEPAAPPPEPPAGTPSPRAAAASRSPRALLATLLEVLGTLPAETLTREYIPRPYGTLVHGLMKSHGWDQDSMAVSLIRGFARQHGWPDDVDPAALRDLEAFGVDDDELLDYLAAAFKKATWDKWAFEVPTGRTVPKRG